MSFLKRAIQDGIRKGVGDAIGKAVQQAVEPTATKLANQAAQSFDQLAGQVHQQQQQQVQRQATGLEQALSNLQRSAENYATETAKNIKLCPSCGEATTAEKSFCPNCGAKLPTATVAEGAVCTACGKQNTVGTKFCSDCGAKLPSVKEEEAAVMAQWDQLLPAYPRWDCGGSPANLECIEADQYIFAVDFHGDAMGARRAVEQYRQLAQSQGFHQAGQYPSKEHLYNKINGICYHIDTEHCFDGDGDCPTLGFYIQEPYGGYDYVKPEPKQKLSLKDLKKDFNEIKGFFK